MSAHQLYVISTHYNIKHVSSAILPQYGSDDKIGPMRLHSGSILAFLDPDIVLNFNWHEDTTCKIVPLDTSKMGPSSTEENSIFISLRGDQTEVYKYISDTFLDLSICKLFDWDDVKFVVPTNDKGVSRGIAYVNFSSNVSLDIVTKIVTFLNGYDRLRCSWVKKRTPLSEVQRSPPTSKKTSPSPPTLKKKGKNYASIPSTPTNAWC